MTSQSPTGTEPTDAYQQAWAAIQNMVMNEGGSWSGRERNHLFLNTGGPRFADVSFAAAVDHLDDGRCVVPLDWDDDGRLDLFLKNRTAPRVRLMRNAITDAGRFLTLDLEGVDCNRDAIGARVEVVADGRTLVRSLRAGEGYLAQGSKRLHFGLGEAKVADSLTVLWPDGSSAHFSDVKGNSRYTLVQGGELKRRVAHTVRGYRELEGEEVEPDDRRVSRLALVEKLPLAALRIPGFDDPERRMASLRGKGPILLTFFSLDCADCVREFRAFKRRKDDWASMGLQVVALSVDGMERAEEAYKWLEEQGLEELGGMADSWLLSALEVVMGEIIGRYPGTPTPTSLLLDREGQLVLFFQGRMAAGELLRDLRALEKLDPKDSSSSAMADGRRTRRVSRDFEGLADDFATLGMDDMAAFYRALADQEN